MMENKEDYVTGKLGNDNYITILGWMVNEYGLSGNDLIIYALIYGTSQYGKRNGFFGSRQTIAKWTNIKSLKTITSILKELCDKKLIVKKTAFVNGQERTVYYASKYNDGSLNRECGSRNAQTIITEFADTYGIEIKEFKKQLIKQDFIDIDTYLPVEENIDEFKNTYFELAEALSSIDISEEDAEGNNYPTIQNQSKQYFKENDTQSKNYPAIQEESKQDNKINGIEGNNYPTIQNTDGVKITQSQGKNYPTPSVNFTHKTTNYSNRETTAAKNKNSAAADSLQNQDTKKDILTDAIREVVCYRFEQPELFSENMYPKIAQICSSYAMSASEAKDFIEWAINDMRKRPHDDEYNYFYSTITKNYCAAKYYKNKIENSKEKAEETKAKEPYMITCKVCGCRHDFLHDCPECGMSVSWSDNPEEIANWKIRWKLQKPMRNKLDDELEEHEKERPHGITDFELYKKWKTGRNEIFKKYETEASV